MSRSERATDRSRRRGKVKPEALTGLSLDFSESPTVWKFLQDDSFVRGLMVRFRSGRPYPYHL
jgi:hypothetical protein